MPRILFFLGVFFERFIMIYTPEFERSYFSTPSPKEINHPKIDKTADRIGCCLITTIALANLAAIGTVIEGALTGRIERVVVVSTFTIFVDAFFCLTACC